MSITSFEKLLNLLIDNNIRFILIGGLAGIYHGSSRLTQDIDVIYDRSDDNIRLIEKALKPINPYLRDAPIGLPFEFDYNTIRSGLNFTLSTDLGSLDLMGEVVGGGTYDLLISSSERVEFGTKYFMCVNLIKLIELKRAAGRAKDLESIAELELILEKS